VGEKISASLGDKETCYAFFSTLPFSFAKSQRHFLQADPELHSSFQRLRIRFQDISCFAVFMSRILMNISSIIQDTGAKVTLKSKSCGFHARRGTLSNLQVRI
jgi:hypothetical protein